MPTRLERLMLNDRLSNTSKGGKNENVTSSVVLVRAHFCPVLYQGAAANARQQSRQGSARPDGFAFPPCDAGLGQATFGVVEPGWDSPRSDQRSIRPPALAFSAFFGDGTTRASNRPIMHGWIARTAIRLLQALPQGQILVRQWKAIGFAR
jgi:hypothetical protein